MNASTMKLHHLATEPRIHPTAFVAKGATVEGDVTLGENASVWFSCVLRGDIQSISVGANSNVQDGSVVHIADQYPTHIGEWVTIGHRAVVHACRIGNEVLVGMGAIILDGAEIGDQCIIGAGALVTQRKKIPAGSLVLGSPATVVRELTPEERADIRGWAERYVALSRAYIAKQGI